MIFADAETVLALRTLSPVPVAATRGMNMQSGFHPPNPSTSIERTAVPVRTNPPAAREDTGRPGCFIRRRVAGAAGIRIEGTLASQQYHAVVDAANGRIELLKGNLIAPPTVLTSANMTVNTDRWYTVSNRDIRTKGHGDKGATMTPAVADARAALPLRGWTA
jgi:hypothetical protein